MKILAELWPLVLATITVLGGSVGAVVLARIAWVRMFLERVRAEARTVVLEVEQTYVDALLRGRDEDSPGGKELTEVEQREALALAVAKLRMLLGLGAIDRALRILGLPRVPAFVDRWLTTQVEARVKELSIEQRAAAGGDPHIAAAAQLASAAVLAGQGAAALGAVAGRPGSGR